MHSMTPDLEERFKRGVRRSRRTLQSVRQRISRGFLQYTYTDEWLAEAMRRWREAIADEPCHDTDLPLNDDLGAVSD